MTQCMQHILNISFSSHSAIFHRFFWKYLSYEFIIIIIIIIVCCILRLIFVEW